MTRWVIYHSIEWGQLADTGWITMIVEDHGKYKVAKMLYEPRRT